MPHTTAVPVNWGDTDAGGLIYYPRFFHFAVVALNDYFGPAADHLMDDLRREGYVLPAVDAAASFESPLRAGETALVESTVETGEASLALAFEVRREADGERAASGETTFVLVDETFDSVPLPDWMHDCVARRKGEHAGEDEG